MAKTLSTLSIISFIIAGVCLVLSVFLWIFFKIPTVIGDLSGRNARKSIAKMRAANEKSGSKSYKASKTNAERGKLTDTMQHFKKLKQEQGPSDDRPETGLLNDNRADEDLSEATGVLEPETTGLLVDENATAPLDNSVAKQPIKREGGVKLKMLDEVLLIHTDEVIGC